MNGKEFKKKFKVGDVVLTNDKQKASFGPKEILDIRNNSVLFKTQHGKISYEITHFDWILYLPS